MKQKFLFASILASAFLSCADENGPSDNNTDNGSSVTSLSEAQALANAVYGPLQTLSSSYSFLLDSSTETTISFEEVDDSKDGPQVSIFETTPSNWYAIKVFNRLYKSIGAANRAIEEIGSATVSSDLSQSDIDLYVARSKFIRGYNYFKLVQIYGEVPLVLSTDSRAKTRASIDDVYEQIVKDLSEAIVKLPEYDAIKSNPTQAAANTILAKVYLTWAQKPLSLEDIAQLTDIQDPVKGISDSEKLRLSIEYADKVIDLNKYRLLDNFNDIWGVVNENNDEVIFSIHHEGDGIDAQGNHQTHCGFTWPKSPRTDPHISYSDIRFETRFPHAYDSRKAYSYATHIEYTDGVVDTLTWPISIVRPGKWIHRINDGSHRAVDEQPNSIDHIDYRYPEVLLLKAEALLLLDRASEALPLINEIRKRAYGGHYEHGGRLSAVNLQDLYNEWDYEFAFEQKHWLNLVRWKTLLSQIKQSVPTFEYYKTEYQSAESIKQAFPEVAHTVNAAFYARVHKHLRAKYNNLNGRQYRFPIPLSEDFTALGIIPQNPGY